ncbi:hypothetical protein BH10PLA2_BH10PLA2_28420 [soil metagenome]
MEEFDEARVEKAQQGMRLCAYEFFTNLTMGDSFVLVVKRGIRVRGVPDFSIWLFGLHPSQHR